MPFNPTSQTSEEHQPSMPVHKIDNRQPKQPPWGKLPLEVYFLSEWEAPPSDPSQSNEPPADRRKRLVRQFLALGFQGRQVYSSLSY